MGKRKDKQVATIEHRSGISVPLMFDPNTDALTFSASYGTSTWSGKAADEVTQKVRDYLDACSALDWKPFIKVTETHPFGSINEKEFVGLDIDRFYLASSFETGRDGRKIVLQLAWDQLDEDEDTRGNVSVDMNRIRRATRFYGFRNGFSLDAVPHHEPGGSHGDVFIIKYSDEIWASLNTIIEGIGRLKRVLRELIGSEEGHAKLAQAGQNMLKLLPALPPPVELTEQEKRRKFYGQSQCEE